MAQNMLLPGGIWQAVIEPHTWILGARLTYYINNGYVPFPQIRIRNALYHNEGAVKLGIMPIKIWCLSTNGKGPWVKMKMPNWFADRQKIIKMGFGVQKYGLMSQRNLTVKLERTFSILFLSHQWFFVESTAAQSNLVRASRLCRGLLIWWWLRRKQPWNWTNNLKIVNSHDFYFKIVLNQNKFVSKSNCIIQYLNYANHHLCRVGLYSTIQENPWLTPILNSWKWLK